jgi:hypothetical protein
MRKRPRKHWASGPASERPPSPRLARRPQAPHSASTSRHPPAGPPPCRCGPGRPACPCRARCRSARPPHLSAPPPPKTTHTYPQALLLADADQGVQHAPVGLDARRRRSALQRHARFDEPYGVGHQADLGRGDGGASGGAGEGASASRCRRGPGAGCLEPCAWAPAACRLPPRPAPLSPDGRPRPAANPPSRRPAPRSAGSSPRPAARCPASRGATT